MKIYLKNTDTNEIIELEAESYEALSKNFRQAPYELTSDDEKESLVLQESKEDLVEKVRQATRDLILTEYSDTDQLNTLMSGDNIAIAEMNSFIEPILTKSRAIRAEILNCDTLDKLNKIKTDL